MASIGEDLIQQTASAVKNAAKSVGQDMTQQSDSQRAQRNVERDAQRGDIPAKSNDDDDNNEE